MFLAILIFDRDRLESLLSSRGPSNSPERFYEPFWLYQASEVGECIRRGEEVCRCQGSVHQVQPDGFSYLTQLPHSATSQWVGERGFLLSDPIQGPSCYVLSLATLQSCCGRSHVRARYSVGKGVTQGSSILASERRIWQGETLYLTGFEELFRRMGAINGPSTRDSTSMAPVWFILHLIRIWSTYKAILR